MKKTLAIAAMALVLPLGCGGSGDDGAAGTAAVPATGAGGDTAAAGSAAAGTGGDSTAAAGASGGGSATDACPNGEAAKEYITITTAEDLATLANCTKLKNLTITGTTITSFDALKKVTTVTGALTIKEPHVADLQGLSNLTSVGGLLAIGLQLKVGSSSLTSLKGLEKLTSIGGNLSINDNALLTDITALSNLKSIGTGKVLQMRDNASLPTCAAHDLAKQLNLDVTNKDATEICGTKNSDSCTWVKCTPAT